MKNFFDRLDALIAVNSVGGGVTDETVDPIVQFDNPRLTLVEKNTNGKKYHRWVSPDEAKSMEKDGTAKIIRPESGSSPSKPVKPVSSSSSPLPQDSPLNLLQPTPTTGKALDEKIQPPTT